MGEGEKSGRRSLVGEIGTGKRRERAEDHERSHKKLRKVESARRGRACTFDQAAQRQDLSRRLPPVGLSGPSLRGHELRTSPSQSAPPCAPCALVRVTLL